MLRSFWLGQDPREGMRGREGAQGEAALPSSIPGPERDSQSLPPLALLSWEVLRESGEGVPEAGLYAHHRERDVADLESFSRRLPCSTDGKAED